MRLKQKGVTYLLSWRYYCCRRGHEFVLNVEHMTTPAAPGERNPSRTTIMPNSESTPRYFDPLQHRINHLALTRYFVYMHAPRRVLVADWHGDGASLAVLDRTHNYTINAYHRFPTLSSKYRDLQRLTRRCRKIADHRSDRDIANSIRTICFQHCYCP
ncbi:hypothetical protein EI94DRAFT_1249809 [Lactarius quietus]|nr:hypothetical protein EI94DRAFT_1249809 [Lactarius quietus]